METEEMERRSNNDSQLMKRRRNTVADIPESQQQMMGSKRLKIGETESGYQIPFDVVRSKFKEEGEQPESPYPTFKPIPNQMKLFKIFKDPQRLIEREIAAKYRESQMNSE